MKETVSTVIVSRGMTGLLSLCVQALKRNIERLSEEARCRIVVVDNGSRSPYDREQFGREDVRVLRFDRHQGFSEANNFAVDLFPARFILLLNNDVILEESTLDALLRLMEEDPGVGICGSRLLFPDGTIQHCGVVFGPGETGPYHKMRKRSPRLVPRTDEEVQAVTGACMLIRLEAWKELGGLDTRYHFGLEDIDFCLRARQKGWRVVCRNETESIHLEAQTPGRVRFDVSSRKRFMQRWRGHYALDG